LSTETVRIVPILTPDDPSFARIARKVVEPPRDSARPVEFFPAPYIFNIGHGSNVDLSWFYCDGRMRDRKVNHFDRHLFTEEVWIARKGNFYWMAAPCRQPDDPQDLPHPEDFNAYVIREGDIFIVKPNVWHDGVWPLTPQDEIEIIVVLSGHRKDLGVDAPVDHITQKFPNDAAIHFEEPRS
jgi:hypothetical protein